MINFIDIGCSDYLISPWNDNQKYINYILAFDIHGLKAYQKTISKKIKLVICKQIVFDKEGKYPFYIYKKKQNSSLFKLNKKVLSQYINKSSNSKRKKIQDRLNIVQTRTVQCVRLDSVIKKIGINFDFIKIDTEGAEFNILKSLGEYIDTQIIGIQIEVWFCNLRHNVVLFKKINDFLEQHNFNLINKLTNGVSNRKSYDYIYLRKDKKKIQQMALIKKIYNF